jgi:hypothetical protein
MTSSRGPAVRAQDDGGPPAAATIMSTHDETKDTSAVRDSRSPSALVRDVIIGTVMVTFVSLAVPAWKIRAEYHKSSDDAPVKQQVSAAEVLRERRSEAVVIITPHRPKILEIAERVVRRETEKREAKRRASASAHSPITGSANVPISSAAASPAQAVPSDVDTPQFDSRQSAQAP